VVDAYAQLAAEGYLSLRQGAARVSRRQAMPAPDPGPAAPRPAPLARFDFRLSAPDVSAFPRSAWLRSLQEALETITNADLGYGDPRGVEALRCALANYLGRCAASSELDDISTEPADPDEFRVHVPPGTRVVEETGNLIADAAAVMPGVKETAARAAAEAVNRTADAVSAARSFLDDLRGHR
jgi:hypothetical protein